MIIESNSTRTARGFSWNFSGSGPNAAALGMWVARNRSRSAYLNNSHIRNATDAYVSEAVGKGVTILPTTHDKEFNKKAQDLFFQWCQVCDSYGALNFNGLQDQSVRDVLQGGTHFMRVRSRKPKDGLPVPIQLQGLESEYLAIDFNRTLNNGNVIKMGIEFNKIGKRLAYWFYQKHPMESYSARLRVNASNVFQMYTPTRPGQLTGDPKAISVLNTTHVLDKYTDAALKAREISAMLTGFIEKPEDTVELSSNNCSSNENSGSAPITPGTFVEGFAGEKPHLFDKDDTGGSFADFVKQQLLSVSAGFGIPYEIVSGDWSNVNDRTVRHIYNEYRRRISAFQSNVLIGQFCRPLWHRFVNEAVLCGALEVKDFAKNQMAYLQADYTPHVAPYVHPLQDVETQIKLMNNNLKSRKQVLSEMGQNPAEVDGMIAQDTNKVIQE